MPQILSIICPWKQAPQMWDATFLLIISPPLPLPPRPNSSPPENNFAEKAFWIYISSGLIMKMLRMKWLAIKGKVSKVFVSRLNEVVTTVCLKVFFLSLQVVINKSAREHKFVAWEWPHPLCLHAHPINPMFFLLLPTILRENRSVTRISYWHGKKKNCLLL